MENWHLFTAAFVLSLVDLSVLGAFLWYQFSTLYFAWHLCPMIVNRICELIAFMFTGGMLPSLFAIVQVPLSLFSTTIYANRQQRLQNKLLLAVYCTLLVYEFLVAVLMIKMGRYLKCPRLRSHQMARPTSSQQISQPYIAFHMFALFTQPVVGQGFPYLNNPESEVSQAEGFVTVQQPDGKKVMLGKVLQSKVEPLQITETDHTNSCIKPSQPTINGHIIDVLEQHNSPIESDPDRLTSRNILEQSTIPVQGQLETSHETNHGLDLVVPTSSYVTSDIELSLGLATKPSQPTINGHIIDVLEQHDSPIESDPDRLTSRNILEQSMIPVQGQLETFHETNQALDPVAPTSSYGTSDIEQSVGMTSEPSLAPMNDITVELETNSDIEPPNTIEVVGLGQGSESTTI